MARKAGVDRRVYVQFVMDETGSVVDPSVIRGVGAGLGEEALRVIAESKWTPGRQRGRAVRVRMWLPIGFQLR